MKTAQTQCHIINFHMLFSGLNPTKHWLFQSPK